MRFLSIGPGGELLPFINLKFYDIVLFVSSFTIKEISCRASLHLFLFCICFRSLLINPCLVFISYFVSVPLRKGYRGLEYKGSFVRLYLCLFIFLIIYGETFGFRRFFCDITYVLCEDRSPVWYSSYLGLWEAGK